jgi:ABC-2 type transport system ATP-binding protein
MPGVVMRAGRQYKAPIAIAAFGEAFGADLQPDARMAVAAAFIAIAEQASGAGDDGFGWRDRVHVVPLATAAGEVTLARPFPRVYPQNMTQSAISIRGLEKTYAGGKQALKGIDLEIPRGSMFGLLGPNGAGKSTMINILAGLVNKTAGSANIWGFDISEHPRNAKASIGIVPQELVFDAFFTPFETLELQAGLFGVPKAKRRSMELLEAVHLADKAHVYSRTLSGGMKRRLLVAKALVHNPPVLVLDEPTAGVDIELRQQLWDYVRTLHTQGTTVVLTTHYLEEAEALCDRIAIVNNGEIVANDFTSVLLSTAGDKKLIVTVDRDLAEIPASLGDRVELKNDRVLTLTYDKRTRNAGQVLAAVAAAGLGVVDVSTQEADLEDVFLELTRGR